MAYKTTSSSSSQPEVADETQDWLLGAGSGWVEARTSCDHLNSLSPDLVELPTPDTPCSRGENPVENWLCLCCKEVLCSRFVNRHMLMHHQQTGHCLALSYSDLSVWCFCCEAYLDAQIILQLRPIHHAAYFLKFSEAPRFPDDHDSTLEKQQDCKLNRYMSFTVVSIS